MSIFKKNSVVQAEKPVSERSDINVPDSLQNKANRRLKSAIEDGLCTESDRMAFLASLNEKNDIECYEALEELEINLQKESTRLDLIRSQLYELYGNPLSSEGENWLNKIATTPHIDRDKLREELSDFQKKVNKTVHYCERYEARARNYYKQGRLEMALKWMQKLSGKCEIFPGIKKLQEKNEQYLRYASNLEGDIPRQKRIKSIRRKVHSALNKGNLEKMDILIDEYQFAAKTFRDLTSDGKDGLVKRSSKHQSSYFQQFAKEAKEVKKGVQGVKEKISKHQQNEKRTKEMTKKARKKMAEDHRAQIAAMLYTEMPWGDTKRQKSDEQKKEESKKKQLKSSKKNRVAPELNEQTSSNKNKQKTVQINEREQELRQDDARDLIRQTGKDSSGQRGVKLTLHRHEVRGEGVDSVAEKGLEGADKATEMFIESQRKYVKQHITGPAKEEELERLQKEKERGGRMSYSRGALWKSWKSVKNTRGGSNLIQNDLEENRKTMDKIVSISTSSDDQMKENKQNEERDEMIQKSFTRLEHSLLKIAA